MVEKESNPDEYPARSLRDEVVELFKGATSSLVPGGFVLAAFIKTEQSRRLEAFHGRTAKRVQALERGAARNLLTRAAEGDQAARDEILSTYSAIRRLVEEAMDADKRQFLASAMASALLWPEDADDLERRYFVRCLSDFETIHVRLLARARDGVMPVRELVNQEGVGGEIAQSAWGELYQRGMVAIESVGGMMNASGAEADRTTARGMRFLGFVGGLERQA